MEFYFYPGDEGEFKEKAVGQFVHTVVFDTLEQKICASFTRKVSKIWEQSCKKNIETDHRIKELRGNDFQVYSWVSASKGELNLPFFKLFN